MLKRQQFGLTETEKVSFPGIDELFHSDEENSSTEFVMESRVISLWGKLKLGTLQSRLDQLQIRSSNKKFRYPNYMIMNLANEIFGFQGWSTQVLEVLVKDFDQVRSETKDNSEAAESKADATVKYSITVNAKVRITLKDGTCHECIGTGNAMNLPEKGLAYRTAKMLAVTDATKNGILQLPVLLDNEE